MVEKRKAEEREERGEVGGFNPERHTERPKEQFGPTPTDDPGRKSIPDLKRCIKEKSARVRDYR